MDGEVFEINNTTNKGDAFDGNSLTFSGGSYCSIGLKFKESKLVGSIKFQTRNDDNHINIGEKYELFYWDKKWITLGRQVAKDTVLYYNTPKNSLLKLKNLKGGVEEHVFCVDKDKQQRWLGFDNY